MNPDATLNTGCYEGQGFSQNFNPTYHAGGLSGHTGIDVSCGYGSPIEALASGLVYSLYPIAQPAMDGYTAVFTLVETPLETFELSYGHVSEIDCKIGDHVQTGQLIAKEGNHGTVYAGNVQITLAMQAAGDHRGSHCHYQKRPVLKTKKPSGYLLSNANGTYRDTDGNYYQIYDYNNGFNGCVDWTRPLFNRDLTIGRYGYDVLLLQRAINLEGCGSFTPTGTFGPLTLAGAVQLQKKRGINPTYGYVGAITRASLNATYHQLS